MSSSYVLSFGFVLSGVTGAAITAEDASTAAIVLRFMSVTDPDFTSTKQVWLLAQSFVSFLTALRSPSVRETSSAVRDSAFDSPPVRFRKVELLEAAPRRVSSLADNEPASTVSWNVRRSFPASMFIEAALKTGRVVSSITLVAFTPWIIALMLFPLMSLTASLARVTNESFNPVAKLRSALSRFMSAVVSVMFTMWEYALDTVPPLSVNRALGDVGDDCTVTLEVAKEVALTVSEKPSKIIPRFMSRTIVASVGGIPSFSTADGLKYSSGSFALPAMSFTVAAFMLSKEFSTSVASSVTAFMALRSPRRNLRVTTVLCTFALTTVAPERRRDGADADAPAEIKIRVAFTVLASVVSEKVSVSVSLLRSIWKSVSVPGVWSGLKLLTTLTCCEHGLPAMSLRDTALTATFDEVFDAASLVNAAMLLKSASPILTQTSNPFFAVVTAEDVFVREY